MYGGAVSDEGKEEGRYVGVCYCLEMEDIGCVRIYVL